MIVPACVSPVAMTSSFDLLVRVSSWRAGFDGPFPEQLISLRNQPMLEGMVRVLHGEVFTEWLRRSPNSQIESSVVQTLRRSPPLGASRSLEWLLPENTTPPERDLFYADLRVLSTISVLRSSTHGHSTEPLSFHTLAIIEAVKMGRGHKGLCLKVIGQQRSISSTHLGRLFQRDVGVPFRKYLKLVRLVEASTLLVVKGVTVREAADQLGYADSCGLCNDFRAAFGMSAAEYRTYYGAAIVAGKEFHGVLL